MDIALWVVAVVLAAAMLGAGGMKLARSRDQLQRNPAMAWTEDFGPPMIKAIGAAEVLGALGLVLPPLVDVATVLTPVAALGLAVLMAGAVATHVRRSENQAILPPLVLFALAAFVAWGRFGPYAF